MAEMEKRTYEQILTSFITELNSKGTDLKYSQLNDKERVELMQILIEQCNEHMRPFVVHILGYKWYWFHYVWFDDFKKYGINCEVAARGLGKSFFWSRILPQYLSFVFTNYRSIISSYNEPATLGFLKGNREDIEMNEVMNAKIPKSKTADMNKTTVDFNNGANIQGISISSQIRGKHVNYFVADDILNDEQKLLPEFLKMKIFATILPTLMRHRGKFTLIGTRFSEDDIYAYFMEKAKEQDDYHYTELSVDLDEENEKIFIIRRDETGEIERREDEDNLYDFQNLLTLKMVEPNLFAREYECRVTSDDDVPFPLGPLMAAKDKELSYQLVSSPKEVYAAGLDFSNSIKKGSDETVLMIGNLDSDNNVVLSNIYSDNTLETPERMAAIKRRMHDFGMVKTLAEQNSMGLTNIQNLNKENFRLEPFHMDRVKKCDITEFASRLVKSNKVRFPYKTAKDQKYTDILIHQLSGVRPKKTRGGLPSYDGTTKHDDYYIGFVLLIKYLHDNKNAPTKIFSWKKSDF